MLVTWGVHKKFWDRRCKISLQACVVGNLPRSVHIHFRYMYTHAHKQSRSQSSPVFLFFSLRSVEPTCIHGSEYTECTQKEKKQGRLGNEANLGLFFFFFQKNAHVD